MDPFDENDLISLGKKLADLDLNDGERAALAALIKADDVSGFVRFDFFGSLRKGFRQTGHRLGLRDPLPPPAITPTDIPKPGRF